MEVEVLPDVAKSSVGVLIDNSTVWRKGQLPAPSTKGKRLPHEAPVSVLLLGVQSTPRCQCPFWRVWFQPPTLGGCTSCTGPNCYLQQRFHTSLGGCLPPTLLWVELLHREVCSSPPLLLPASLEVMSMDSCPPRVTFGSRLVHFLA